MALPELRERAALEGVPLSIVAAESLHVILLDALFAHPRSQGMAFQGGTCLHLVHGGQRYSEDVDLAGDALDADAARRIVHGARGEAEKMAVQALGPGDHAWKVSSRPSRVSTYWFHFTPDTWRQRIRVKLEFAHFPVYRPAVLPVRSELDLLRRQPLVHALEPPELLAEKVVAVLGRRYLKERDLFDLWYLDVVLRAPLDPELLAQRVEDYGVAVTREKVRQRTELLAEADLESEMERFLPQRYRAQLGGDAYRVVRRSAQHVVERVPDALGLR